MSSAPTVNVKTDRRLLNGPAGQIEVAVDHPEGAPRGIALVAHPHPLFGGTLDNKVAQTLARAMVELGYLCVRPNFRGVGQSAGVHDEGRGETDDLLAVLDVMLLEAGLTETVLAGFSFGSFVQTQVAQRLLARGTPARRLVLVGTAVGRFSVADVPADTVVIHGEHDETVLLSDVFDWARPQELPVIVIPGADHFFHRKLTLIKSLVVHAWRGEASETPGTSGTMG